MKFVQRAASDACVVAPALVAQAARAQLPAPEGVIRISASASGKAARTANISRTIQMK
jgi:hypothetical protein